MKNKHLPPECADCPVVEKNLFMCCGHRLAYAVAEFKNSLSELLVSKPPLCRDKEYFEG